MKIIIHGPQGCGKTSNSHRLAAFFGIEQVVDNWDGVSPLPEQCMALTNAPCFAVDIAPGVRVLDFDEAMWLVNTPVIQKEPLTSNVARLFKLPALAGRRVEVWMSGADFPVPGPEVFETDEYPREGCMLTLNIRAPGKGMCWAVIDPYGRQIEAYSAPSAEALLAQLGEWLAGHAPGKGASHRHLGQVQPGTPEDV